MCDLNVPLGHVFHEPWTDVTAAVLDSYQSRCFPSSIRHPLFLFHTKLLLHSGDMWAHSTAEPKKAEECVCVCGDVKR